MRATVHPNRPLLLIGADSFADCNELMGDRISFFPNLHLEWPAMDVLHDMDLALMFRQRQAARPVGQTPMPCLIVDRKPDEFDKRRTWTAFRFVFVIRPGRSPKPRQVQLRKRRGTHPQCRYEQK